jgi:hypothetical protein
MSYDKSLLSSHVEAKESIVYSYTKSFNAFAAKLSEDEANKLSGMNEVLSVIPNQYRKLHTTRSWDFIGLPLTAKRKLKSEGDTIVALLDTGLWYLSTHYHFLFSISLLFMIDFM